MPIRYCWTTFDSTHEGEVSGFEEALQVFEAARNALTPIAPIVEFWDENERTLTVAAGQNVSIAGYQGNGDPPYLGSFGGGTGDAVEFIHCNTTIDQAAEWLIPVATARACLKDFFDAPGPPQSIAWQEV